MTRIELFKIEFESRLNIPLKVEDLEEFLKTTNSDKLEKAIPYLIESFRKTSSLKKHLAKLDTNDILYTLSYFINNFEIKTILNFDILKVAITIFSNTDKLNPTEMDYIKNYPEIEKLFNLSKDEMLNLLTISIHKTGNYELTSIKTLSAETLLVVNQLAESYPFLLDFTVDFFKASLTGRKKYLYLIILLELHRLNHLNPLTLKLVMHDAEWIVDTNQFSQFVGLLDKYGTLLETSLKVENIILQLQLRELLPSHLTQQPMTLKQLIRLTSDLDSTNTFKYCKKQNITSKFITQAVKQLNQNIDWNDFESNINTMCKYLQNIRYEQILCKVKEKILEYFKSRNMYTSREFLIRICITPSLIAFNIYKYDNNYFVQALNKIHYLESIGNLNMESIFNNILTRYLELIPQIQYDSKLVAQLLLYS